MNTNETNRIDELFRDELSDYAVPVAVSTLPLMSAVVKKGLFYKLSLLKLNMFTIVTIGTGTITITGVSIGAVKLYEHYQNKHTAMHSVQIVNRAVVKETTAPQELTDAQTQKIEEINVSETKQTIPMETQNAKTASANSSTQTNSKTINSQQVTSATSTQNNATMADKQTSKTASVAALPQTTIKDQSLEEASASAKHNAQTNSATSTVTDSTQAVAQARKVVYVKPNPVVIQDTIVRVVKKKISK